MRCICETKIGLESKRREKDRDKVKNTVIGWATRGRTSDTFDKYTRNMLLDKRSTTNTKALTNTKTLYFRRRCCCSGCVFEGGSKQRRCCYYPFLAFLFVKHPCILCFVYHKWIQNSPLSSYWDNFW